MIVDLGTGYLKYGFPGLPRPKVTRACYKSDDTDSGDVYLHQLDPSRRGLTFPMENGNLPNAASLDLLFQRMFDQLALIQNKRKTIDVQILVFSTVDQNRVYEVCNELKTILGCQRMLAAYQQVLTLLFMKKHTGIVVDVGYSITLIAPIYQGFLLRNRIIDIATGSFFISAALRQHLLEKVQTSPKKESVQFIKIANDPLTIDHIKRTLCQVVLDPQNFEKPRKAIRYRRKNIDIFLGSIAWQAPEVLFDPSLIGIGDAGIIEAIAQVLQNVDPTIRNELASDIVLTGGGSIFPGFRSRVQHELETLFPHLPINIYALQNAFSHAWSSAALLAQNPE